MEMLKQRINFGRCSEDRMLATLDTFLTKEFQAECTWTGASRKGPKTGIMSHNEFVNIFIEIGSSSTEIANLDSVISFFMKKLKNAKKRLSSKGQRRGSRHNIPKRSRTQEPDNSHENVDSSGNDSSENDCSGSSDE